MYAEALATRERQHDVSTPDETIAHTLGETPRATEPDLNHRGPGGQVVPSVQRAIRILNALAAGPSEASLASLSRRLQLPRSSTLALCNTLVESEMLSRGPDGTYRLGPHVLELSRSLLGQIDLHSEFERVLERLGVLGDQTVVVGVLREDDVVFVGRRSGRYPLGISYEIGMRLPAHCTATGLAILAEMGDEEVRARYGGREDPDLPTLTARSIASVPQLLDRLQRVRAAGYALDNEETNVGVIGVGAAVHDSSARVAGAVSVAMAKAAVHEREIRSVAADVQRLASGVSAALGGA
jgi:DNA-binding IclR family transcriptional regulator